MRFEKTIEGIQDVEKARILKAEWKASGNTAKLNALKAALDRFTTTEIPTNGAEPSVYQAKKALE